MSKNWYPVINYSTCSECGACIDKCKHGVYSKESGKKPVVIYPEGCVDGCRGCQNLCPTNSIEYAGDDKKSKNCGCCSCC